MASVNLEHTVFLGHQENDDADVVVPLPKMTVNKTARYQQLDDRMLHAARLREEKVLHVGVNPLLMAASPLFQAISEVSIESYAAPAGLKEELVKRIKEFEFMALSQGCDNTEIIASRYVLCTVLDEVVVTKPWSSHLDWTKNSLLIIFHNEANGGEKLFQLLDKLSRNPTKHINILELIYVCLSLGYEGKYRVLQRGLAELEAIRNSLYRQIRLIRGDHPKDLAINWQSTGTGKQKLPIYVPVWLILVMALCCLGLVYAGFDYVLDQQTHVVTELYQDAAQQQGHNAQ
ncbi:type IVB secretion system protein IcmH/DotU [Tolumonas lignilytica]|uniref:type IVB secretion system protein IcmH/DotU n=1 Tax=Tolumonas lignilytica TaxID=1283284 RepID=UPI0004659457|nr:type IVB secretion system protein IcmH/DotU [Tolumonas lignilytica]